MRYNIREVVIMQPLSPATFTESLAQLRRALADADPQAAGESAPFEAAAEAVAAAFTAAPEGERPRLLLRALDEAIAAVEIAARLADELHGPALRPEAFEEGRQPEALTLAYREFVQSQTVYAPLYAYRNTLAGQMRTEAQPAPHERSAKTGQTELADAPAESAASGMGVDRLNDTSAYQRCFACGAHNTAGLRLVFRREGEEIVTEFTPGERFQGFPGVVHGGILATLLDETLSRTATVEGRWMMTGRLEIRYRGPAPVGRALRVTARMISSRARMVRAAGEIRLADAPETLIATADGTFLPVPPRYQDDVVERYPELAGFFAI
jgi:acyl-coenzyme A thioesterase PaaI-like protein